MRRADRLMKITHFLRQRRRAVTANRIAEEFEISVRTVYRDIQDLMDTGVPIIGEAGVGYLIDKQYYLPPITFDSDELEAIGLGINMVRQWTDDKFAQKANSAMEKVFAALPAELQGELAQITTHVMQREPQLPWTISFSGIRESIRVRRKLVIDYRDVESQKTTRTIRPLALMFFSPVWLLAAWCEKREDFRHFRLDRINTLSVSDDTFADEAGTDLIAYVKSDTACSLEMSAD